MARRRWPAELLPDELGAVVHGPVVLARSPGIAAGLRCIFAHPGGLHLPLVLRARGVQAEAAGRHSSPRGRRAVPSPTAAGQEPWSELILGVEMDGESGIADPTGQTSSGHVDAFDLEATYWIGALPRDGRLRLTVAWPRAGLTESSTLLTLAGLDDLGDQVVRLC